MTLVKNNLLTILPNMGMEWRVSFFFNPSSYTYNNWANVIHLTAGGNRGTSGDRIPAIFYHPAHGISVLSDVNGNPNVYKPFKPSPAPTGKWTLITISQMKKDNIYVYRIVIGDSDFEMQNTKPAEFKNVKVFASNPWYKAQAGSIKELTVQSNGCQAKRGTLRGLPPCPCPYPCPCPVSCSL